jgi:hypothetical protein
MSSFSDWNDLMGFGYGRARCPSKDAMDSARSEVP